MLHHIDVHVRDLARTRQWFDAIAECVGYRARANDPGDEDDFAGYEPSDGGRPRIGFIADGSVAAGSVRIAFSAASRAGVDAAAAAIASLGARALEGPSVHPEYGNDYYAVFFEDGNGNRYEIMAPAEDA
jgi:catechol 2,3-dioxygenase-like lactoylglutathione lyase family enzyme